MICWSETGERGSRVVFITVLTGLVCMGGRGGRGFVNFSSSSASVGLAALTTTCWRTARGETCWGGGVQGRVICWIIRPGLTVLVGRGRRAEESCKQGGGLSPNCWITKCLLPVWPGPPGTA